MKEEYCYKKIYGLPPNGNLYLENPEPAKTYIENNIFKLMQCANHEEEREEKLRIFREFSKIYEYDCKTAIRPEPFGSFQDETEKQGFIKSKQLFEDVNLYLGTIFYNFHETLYRQGRAIPILQCPKLVIDYDELYLRAVNEYFGSLLGIPYPIQIGTKIPVSKSAALPYQATHACGTAFILPALIDHFLLMYLQNRLLYFGLGRMAEMGKVSLSEEEEQLLSGFAAARRRRHGTFGGTKEQTMAQVYEMLVRHGILSDTLDHEQILVGKSKRGIATLGMIFRSPYAKREIKPEYYELLSYLFDNKQLNIRNCIMHGNSVTYDYLQIGISAVMLQLLWDIANDDIFIS